MSGLVLEGISKRFNTVAAVDHVDLAVPNGTFVCMLGPSGCGKTTLLRTIAGLEEPTSGRILIDGKDITKVPAHQRDFGMVFQSLALFPHLNVGENVAYPLRIRGVGKVEQAKRASPPTTWRSRCPLPTDRKVSETLRRTFLIGTPPGMVGWLSPVSFLAFPPT
jgi:ABC-type Fe3+/spermidine/putrescine transport system ATPase subunit